MNKITFDQIEKYREAYESDRTARTMNAAMAKTELTDLAFIPMNAAKLRGDFSIELRTRGITAQEKSGRCWMFAATNILREIVAEKLNIKEFELSQNYLAFYDKFEKSNNYLEMIIENADKDLDDMMMHYLSSGIGDGGYWDMAVDLVKKYGAVPKYVMPESYQSSHTERFMKLLNNLLKKDAAELRKMIHEGKPVSDRKDEMMSEIYKALCIVFGEPVRTFDFEYRDEKKEFHADYDLTPKEFYDKYIGNDLDEYICISNSPTEATPLDNYYKFHYAGSMAESDIHSLNLTMDEVQDLVIKQLQDNEPVWFACDAGAYGDRKQGVWDPDSFDYEGLLGGASFEMEKSESLEYNQSSPTHAMILVGVNFDKNGEPNRWKIENSWGKEVGLDGYFVCSQTYFRRYVYEAIINKKYLTSAEKALLEKEPIELTPWIGSVL